MMNVVCFTVTVCVFGVDTDRHTKQRQWNTPHSSLVYSTFDSHFQSTMLIQCQTVTLTVDCQCQTVSHYLSVSVRPSCLVHILWINYCFAVCVKTVSVTGSPWSLSVSVCVQLLQARCDMCDLDYSLSDRGGWSKIKVSFSVFSQSILKRFSWNRV